MKKEVYICDKCNKEKPCESLFVKQGRQSNGIEWEDYGEDLDICHYCAVKWLQSFMK